MSSRRRLMIATLATVALGVSAGGAAAQHIPGAAARVNGAQISNFRLERHFEEYLRTQRRNLTTMINPRVYKKLKREALDQLIEREVLWQAAREREIVVSDEEVNGALAQVAAQFKTRESFLRKLNNEGYDEPAFRDVLRRDLSGVRYLVRQAGTPEVTEEEIAADYRQDLQRYTRPELVRARHILIKLRPGADTTERETARARIASVLEELRKGADFAELARRSSEDATAADGGDLGEFSRGRMVRPFDEAVFALSPGQVSDVVETRYGFHLIRLESRTEAQSLPLEQVRDAVRDRLLARKRTLASKAETERLIKAAKIEIFIPPVD